MLAYYQTTTYHVIYSIVEPNLTVTFMTSHTSTLKGICLPNIHSFIYYVNTLFVHKDSSYSIYCMVISLHTPELLEKRAPPPPHIHAHVAWVR